MIEPSVGRHPHTVDRPAGGRRVWLGELLACHNLVDAPLTSLPELKVTATPESVAHAPVPVRFHLPEDGFVTLVIEDETGQRVRNLVSETPFPAGDNVVWWDATDDLGRDVEAARHGLYNIPAQLVSPGRYTARGLWRKEIQPFYEFAVYGTGNPPWSTPDHTGAWLANHSPPSAAVFVPAAVIAHRRAERLSGLLRHRRSGRFCVGRSRRNQTRRAEVDWRQLDRGPLSRSRYRTGSSGGCRGLCRLDVGDRQDSRASPNSA